MIYKRCRCKSTQCTHPWYVRLNLGGRGSKPEVGVQDKYARLLARAGKHLPTTKSEALVLEGLVRTWVRAGRPDYMLQSEGASAAPINGQAFRGRDKTPITCIAEAAREYKLHYLDKKRGMSDPGIIDAIVAMHGSLAVPMLQDRATAANYLDAVLARTTKTTSNRHFSRWSHFLNWCRAEYKFPGESPFYHQTLRPHGLRKHEEKDHRWRRLVEGEEAALLAGIATLGADAEPMRGRFFCALDAMLRRGEMLAVKREDIIRDRATGATLIRIPKGNAKSGKMREIPVLSKRLLAFIESRRFAPFVFGHADGSQMRGHDCHAAWEAVLQASGISQGAYQTVATPRAKGRKTQTRWIWTLDGNLHWHDLRHEGASRLHESHKVPLRGIQKILGHTSLATTEKYLNPTDKGLVENLREYALAAGI